MALLLDLVTPEKTLLSQEVYMAVIPGRDGDFGVLEGHTQLISSIRPGVIDIHNESGISERIFIAGGFAEVTNERCTVLATEAFNLADANADDARIRLENAERELECGNDDTAKEAAHKKIETAEALINALS